MVLQNPYSWVNKTAWTGDEARFLPPCGLVLDVIPTAPRARVGYLDASSTCGRHAPHRYSVVFIGFTPCFLISPVIDRPVVPIFFLGDAGSTCGHHTPRRAFSPEHIPCFLSGSYHVSTSPRLLIGQWFRAVHGGLEKPAAQKHAKNIVYLVQNNVNFINMTLESHT
jgi:hypothetical protein